MFGGGGGEAPLEAAAEPVPMDGGWVCHNPIFDDGTSI